MLVHVNLIQTVDVSVKKSRNPLMLFISLSLCTCLLLFCNFGRSHTLLLDRIINLGHVPLFAVVAGMVLWVLDRRKWISTDRKNYGWAFVVSGVLGLATEIVQHFTPGRLFEVRDVMNVLVEHVQKHGHRVYQLAQQEIIDARNVNNTVEVCSHGFTSFGIGWS